ncbi:MAG: hypothetical protein HYW70_00050 [Candidatus Nealsonbacteria bacterium]|nr:hypothetical protein [Candidatus Nealsonbacteria bacterium]
MAEAEFTQENITQQAEDAAAKERVSALDPDFILVLMFALLMDGLDIILFIIKLLPLGVPGTALHVIELIDTPLDLFTFAVVGGWMYLRVNRIAKKRKEQIQALKKQVGPRTANLEKQLLGKISSPFKRVALRGGVSMAAESSNFILPLLGAFIELIPFWAITVVLTLREK